MPNTSPDLSRVHADDRPFVDWVILNADLLTQAFSNTASISEYDLLSIPGAMHSFVGRVLDDIDSTRAIIAYAQGKPIEYVKPSTGEWVALVGAPKFADGRVYRPKAEQPTPEQPTPEQPTPEQPTPEQPTPEADGKVDVARLLALLFAPAPCASTGPAVNVTISINNFTIENKV